MAKNTASPPKRRANLEAIDLPKAIGKLERRIAEINGMPLPSNNNEITPMASNIATKINATYDGIYGVDTVEAEEAHISATNFMTMFFPAAWSQEIEIFSSARQRAIAQMQTSVEILRERLDENTEDTGARILQAYENLELHPEITSAASKLYKDGHYANAIEDAVKALNNLVRLRSGVDNLDGSKLMNRVFSPESPILKFNSLADESDKDEQRGFMMMFSGAVAGLRNPRAHKLIKDDPERALEFIAFVSLLAKLLGGAKK
jgi:uncharacterized protein (TIGR02391 family)